jgi:hypothetical protein
MIPKSEFPDQIMRQLKKAFPKNTQNPDLDRTNGLYGRKTR